MNVEIAKIQASVEAIAHLFEEGAKVNASDNDFFDTLIVLGFNPQLSEQLKQVYVDGKNELRLLKKSTCFDLPHFVNLDWRLDVQVFQCV